MFDNHTTHRSVAEENVIDMHYLDGFVDGMNELLSVVGRTQMMQFHPDTAQMRLVWISC